MFFFFCEENRTYVERNMLTCSFGCCSSLQILGWDICCFSCLLAGTTLHHCAQSREETFHGSIPAPLVVAVRWRSGLPVGHFDVFFFV
jgi:hypothetical protein